MTDLGDLTRIATALGLVRDGSPNGEWFAEPDRFLAQVLSTRSNATRSSGPSTTCWRWGRDRRGTLDPGADPGARRRGALDLVIDVVDGGRRVHLGLGVRVRRTADTDSAGVRIEAYVPLFAAAGSEQVASPLLLGAADGTIELELAVDMPTATAVGGVALTAVELGARIPTIGDAIPALTLALRGLRMPGAPDLDRPRRRPRRARRTRRHAHRARARAAARPHVGPPRERPGARARRPARTHPRRRRARLPLRRARRTRAGRARRVVGERARRCGASILAPLPRRPPRCAGGDPAGRPVVVALDLGGDATLTIGLDVLPGAAGLPRVIPNLTVETRGATGVTLALEAQPVSVDLATRAAVALPVLRLLARVADPAGGSLLGPVDSGTPAMSVRLGSLEAGFALDADRRPTLVLAALDAEVGATPYDRLDLTNGDAVAAAAAQDRHADRGESRLRPRHPRRCARPAHRAERARARRPRAAAQRPDRRHPRLGGTLDESAATVRGVLQTLQGAISDAARAADLVAGAGTTADPYRIALAEGVDLVITRDGTRVAVDLAVRRASDLPDGALGGARMALDARERGSCAPTSPPTAAASFATGLLAIVRRSPRAPRRSNWSRAGSRSEPLRRRARRVDA